MLLSFSFINHADCPHCFRIAKVKITMDNKKDIVGYMPFFSFYYSKEKLKDNSMKKNQLDLFDSKVAEIIFYKNAYKIKRIGMLFAKEDKLHLKTSKMKYLKILNWGETGAAKLAEYPRSKLIEIQNLMKNIEIIKKTDFGANYYFINAHQGLANSVFKNIIDISPRKLNEDFFNTKKIEVLMEKYADRSLRDKQKRLRGVFNKLEATEYGKYKQVSSVYEGIKKLNFNKSYKKYLKSADTIIRKRVRFARAVKKYIKNNDIKILHNFIKNNIDNNKVNKALLDLIEKENEDNIFSIVKSIWFHSPNEFSIRESFYQKMLDENRIFIIIKRWD